MNLYREMERLTEPPVTAGKVRVLTPEEIACCVVTPLEAVHSGSFAPRVSMPGKRCCWSLFGAGREY